MDQKSNSAIMMMPTDRPTIAEIRRIGQPPSVTGRSNAEHWVADLYLRKISPYLTRLLLRTPITANGVTYLMIITGISTGLFLLIPGFIGIILALFACQLQMLWDCCDGEVARWRKMQSPVGVFLDKVGHYCAESIIPICFGLRLANYPEEPITNSIYPLMGALLSVFILINKGLNDAVHVARSSAGLEKLNDEKSVGTPRKTTVRILRRFFDYFPIQRAFHSVELTIIIAIFGSFKQSLQIILIAAIFVTIGHFLSIITSSKLQK